LLWEPSKDILKMPLLGAEEGAIPFGKMTPFVIKVFAQENYFFQGCIPVLKGASGKPHPLFKAMLKENRHSNLLKQPDSISGPSC
jgi:hypothetical protein